MLESVRPACNVKAAGLFLLVCGPKVAGGRWVRRKRLPVPWGQTRGE